MDIGGWDIVTKTNVGREFALYTVVMECFKVWPDAILEDADIGVELFDNTFDPDKHREIIICRDKESSDDIDKNGVTDENSNWFVHAIMPNNTELTLCVHHGEISNDIQKIVLNILSVVNLSKHDEISERFSRPLSLRYQ